MPLKYKKHVFQYIRCSFFFFWSVSGISHSIKMKILSLEKSYICMYVCILIITKIKDKLKEKINKNFNAIYFILFIY